MSMNMDADRMSREEIEAMRKERERRAFVKHIMLWAVACFVCVMLLFAAVMGVYMISKTIGRAQHRADAHNQVSISNIEIQNQEQRIQVAKQKAEIRLQDAIGVRSAQDEIAKTLTPLYVQFEMVDALKAIATSGSNNSVVYIPTGANGIPLISDATQGKVEKP